QPIAYGTGLTTGFQAPEGVQTQRLQEPVAGRFPASFDLHQRLLDQLGEEVEYVCFGDPIEAANSFGKLECPAVREAREPAKQCAFIVGQELVTPVDRCQ